MYMGDSSLKCWMPDVPFGQARTDWDAAERGGGVVCWSQEELLAEPLLLCYDYDARIRPRYLYLCSLLGDGDSGSSGTSSATGKARAVAAVAAAPPCSLSTLCATTDAEFCEQLAIALEDSDGGGGYLLEGFKAFSKALK